MLNVEKYGNKRRAEKMGKKGGKQISIEINEMKNLWRKKKNKLLESKIVLNYF